MTVPSLKIQRTKAYEKIHNLNKQAPQHQFSSPLQKDKSHVLSHPVPRKQKLARYNYNI